MPLAQRTTSALLRAVSQTLTVRILTLAFAVEAHVRTSALCGTSHSTHRQTYVMAEYAPRILTVSVVAHVRIVFARVGQILENPSFQRQQLMIVLRVYSGCGSCLEWPDSLSSYSSSTTFTRRARRAILQKGKTRHLTRRARESKD